MQTAFTKCWRTINLNVFAINETILLTAALHTLLVFQRIQKLNLVRVIPECGGNIASNILWTTKTYLQRGIDLFYVRSSAYIFLLDNASMNWQSLVYFEGSLQMDWLKLLRDIIQLILNNHLCKLFTGWCAFGSKIDNSFLFLEQFSIKYYSY